MKVFAILFVAALVVAQEPVAQPDTLGLTEVKPAKTLNTSQFKPVTILGVHPNNHNGNHSGKDTHTGFSVTPHIVSLEEINNINGAKALDPLQSGQNQVVTPGQPFRSAITTPPPVGGAVVTDNAAYAPVVAPTPDAAPAPTVAAPVAAAPAAPVAAAPAAPVAAAPAAPAAPVTAPAANASVVPPEDQNLVKVALSQLKEHLNTKIAKLSPEKQEIAKTKAAELMAKVEKILLEKLGNLTLSDGMAEEHRRARSIIDKVQANMETAGGLLMSDIESLTASVVKSQQKPEEAKPAETKEETKEEVKEEVKQEVKQEVQNEVQAGIEKALGERDEANKLALKVTEKAMKKVESELHDAISGIPGKQKDEVIQNAIEAQKDEVTEKLKHVKTPEEAKAIIKEAVETGKTQATAEEQAIKEAKAQATELAEKSIRKVTEKYQQEVEALPEGPEKKRAEEKIEERQAVEVKELAKELSTADTAEEAKELIAAKEEEASTKMEARIEKEKEHVEEKHAEEAAILANATAANPNATAANATEGAVKEPVDAAAAKEIATKAVAKVQEDLESKIQSLPESEQAVANEEAEKVVAKAEKKVEEKLKTGEVNANDAAAVQELTKDTTKTAMKREARREAVKEQVKAVEGEAKAAKDSADKSAALSAEAIKQLEAKVEDLQAAPAAAGGAPATGLIKKLESKIEKLESKEKGVEKEEASLEKKETAEEEKETEKSGALRDAHNKLVEDLKTKLEDATKDVSVLKDRVTSIAANQTADHDLLIKIQASVDKLAKVEVKNAEETAKEAEAKAF